MFEQSGALRTWALYELPTAQKGAAAEQLPAHRLAYLDYEGPVSGNRGTVTRCDGGTYELVSDQPDQWCARLRGERWIGTLTLQLSDGQAAQWTAQFRPR